MKRAPQQDWLFLLGLTSLACAVGDNSTTPSPFSAGDFGEEGDDDDDDDEDDDDAADTEDNSDDSPIMDGTTGGNDDGPADGPADDGPADGPGGTTGSMDDAGDAVTSMPNDDAGPLDDAGMEDGYASDDGAPVGSPCMAYAANVANCFGGDPKLYEYYCYGDLEFYAAIYGPACASAWEELYACIGSVSCMELSAGQGCDPEVAGVQASC